MTMDSLFLILMVMGYLLIVWLIYWLYVGLSRKYYDMTSGPGN